MKVAAIVLALAGVGSSILVCRDLMFKTGHSCPWGYSSTNFKLMPFEIEIDSKCHLTKGSECKIKVCGTNAEFSKPLVVAADKSKSTKVNSWNFNIFVDEMNVPLVPKMVCTSRTSTFCCGMQTRLDKDTQSAEFTWPKLVTPTPSVSPSLAPFSVSPSSAPTRSPTAAEDPTTSPSRAPTAPRPCNQLNNEECKASGVCRATNGKKGKRSCENAKCKKFKKNSAMCNKAPHCKFVKTRKKTKCVSK